MSYVPLANTMVTVPKTLVGYISFYLYLDHSNATGADTSLTFTLLDDAGEPVSVYRDDDDIIHTFTPVDNGWPGWGFPRFITRKALEESNFHKDDCFRVRYGSAQRATC